MPRRVSQFQYCAGCRLRDEACICREAPRIVLETRVIVVMHALEWAKTSNTGHLVRLALANSEIRQHGMPRQPVADDVSDALVLFPGPGSEPLTPELVQRPATLLVPDGNWNQAKNMLRRVPILRRARPVRIDGESAGVGPVRQNDVAGRVSTFEAIARALGVLEGIDREKILLGLLRQFLTRKNVDWRTRSA